MWWLLTGPALRVVALLAAVLIAAFLAVDAGVVESSLGWFV